MGGLSDVKHKKLLYHLTSLDNIESIILNGIVSRASLIDMRVGFYDVANVQIMNKRTTLGLDKYVPFHFHPYSSFDVAVKRLHPDKNFLYLCVQRSFAEQNQFLILPKHPLSTEECVLYKYDRGFDMVDWDVMSQPGNDEYSKQVKMAECLSQRRVPMSCINQIIVRDDRTKRIVEEKFQTLGIPFSPPYINVQNLF